MEKMAAVGTTRIQVHFYEQLWIYDFHMSEILLGMERTHHQTIQKLLKSKQLKGKMKVNEKQEHTLNLPRDKQRDIKNIFGNCSHKVDFVYLFKSN